LVWISPWISVVIKSWSRWSKWQAAVTGLERSQVLFCSHVKLSTWSSVRISPCCAAIT
jgi:hypothetical protein